MKLSKQVLVAVGLYGWGALFAEIRSVSDAVTSPVVAEKLPSAAPAPVAPSVSTPVKTPVPAQPTTPEALVAAKAPVRPDDASSDARGSGSDAAADSGPDEGEDEESFSTTVSAARVRRPLTDEVAVHDVVGAPELRARAVMTLADAVTLVNGVRIESNCQSCNTTEVMLSGLGGGYNLVVFDGIPLLSTLGAVYGIEQIPVGFAGRIEVVKGVGALFYGPGAITGVVNVIPEEATENGGYIHTGIEVQHGVPGYYSDGRADAVSADGKLSFSFVGQGYTRHEIDYNDDGLSDSARRKQAMTGGLLRYRPNEDTLLKAEYTFTYESRRGGDEFALAPHQATVAESLYTRYHRAGLGLEFRPDSDWKVGLTYALAVIGRDSYYGGLGDPTAPGYDPVAAAALAFDQYGETHNVLHFGDARTEWRGGDHRVTFGVQQRYETVRDRNLDGGGRRLSTRTDASYGDTGLYVADVWRVTPRLELSGGVRVDKHTELANPVFSPRVAAGYEFSPGWTVSGSVASGFRAPEVFSEDLHVATLGGVPVPVVNAPGLKKEDALTARLGLEWRSSAVAPKWLWDASVYNTMLRDTFVLTRRFDGSGREIEERTNGSGANVTGVESNLAFSPVETFTLSLGGAMFSSRYDEDTVVYDDTGDGGSTVLSRREFLKTPRWTALTKALWRPNDDWSLSAVWNLTGAMSVLNNNTATINRTPVFHVVDLAATRHFDIEGFVCFDLLVGVKNVFDQRQRDLEYGPSRDSDYVYGPRHARTWHVSLRCRF